MCQMYHVLSECTERFTTHAFVVLVFNAHAPEFWVLTSNECPLTWFAYCIPNIIACVYHYIVLYDITLLPTISYPILIFQDVRTLQRIYNLSQLIKPVIQLLQSLNSAGIRKLWQRATRPSACMGLCCTCDHSDCELKMTNTVNFYGLQKPFTSSLHTT